MKKIFGILLALALMVSLGLVTAAPVAAQITDLDHFKCYPVVWTAPYVGEDVSLEDQFGTVEAEVGRAQFFCNPVAKWHDETPSLIVNWDNHLTLYSLYHHEEPHERIVKVDNQFGTQQLVLSDPVLLGVPTQKEGHYSPEGLDHFLLYEVTEGTPMDVVIGLEDQFLSEYVSVYEPVYFANPVRKTDGGGVTEIENPEAHLVFYRIASYYSITGEVWVYNQFDEQELEVYMDEDNPSLLAVPSEKVSIGPVVYPVRNIDTEKGYFTIQAAIDDPETLGGHTIEVAAGEYDAFVVVGKENISIIGAEGATVTTTNLYTALPVVGNAWVLAAVYDSEDVNIEGINFDGTDISDEEVVVGIAYVDSTGRIADLTVENVIATELGAGVAIIGHAGTSAVEMTGATVSNNDRTGIYVCGGSTLEAHFNKIAGNAECGLLNDGGKRVDATGNWWGHKSGPRHQTDNPLGMGDVVIGDVDFKPWLGAAEIVVKTVTNDTVDAKTEADTEVEVKGTATVTIARYATNPHPPTSTLTSGAYAAPNSHDFVALDTKFRDVLITNTKPGTEIEIRLYYTDAEVKDFDEESLHLRWWNGDDWVACSDSDVNMDSTKGYNGYMWAKITDTTTPSLENLQGTPWGGYGSPSSAPKPICFIATAAYGTDTAKELDILREFRDAVLLPNSLGVRFVSLYYKTSPPIANFISQHEVLRTAVRVGFVDPIVKILNWSHALWSTRGS